MVEEFSDMVDSYSKWLRDKTQIRRVSDEWTEITTPFLDSHNDMLQIYAKKVASNRYLLTDDGYVITDLEQSGCSLNSDSRQNMLKCILNGLNVKEADGELFVESSREDFASRKHDLIQAMMAVNDLIYVAQPTVQRLFHDDVAVWLDSIDARSTANVKITGKSSLNHSIDFIIPKSRNAPERIIQAINTPSKSNIQNCLFKWLDIKEDRDGDAKSYAFINNQTAVSNRTNIDALNKYNIIPVFWSDRDRYATDLAA